MGPELQPLIQVCAHLIKIMEAGVLVCSTSIVCLHCVIEMPAELTLRFGFLVTTVHYRTRKVSDPIASLTVRTQVYSRDSECQHLGSM